MKRSLDYLPRNKQNTIRAIVKIIRDAVEVEMVILFGSFARDGTSRTGWHLGWGKLSGMETIS